MSVGYAGAFAVGHPVPHFEDSVFFFPPSLNSKLASPAGNAVASFASENRLQPCLQIPGRARGTDHPEGRSSNLRIGRAKRRRVGGVKHLGPELQPEPLCDPERFVNREIEIGLT